MWRKYFLFCFFLLSFFPAAAQDAEYRQITEAELSRLEAISVLLEQQSTEREKSVAILQSSSTAQAALVKTLQEQLKTLNGKLSEATALSRALPALTAQAKTYIAKSGTSLAAYADESSSALLESNNRATRAETLQHMWQLTAIVEDIAIALMVALYVVLRKLKVI